MKSLRDSYVNVDGEKQRSIKKHISDRRRRLIQVIVKYDKIKPP